MGKYVGCSAAILLLSSCASAPPPPAPPPDTRAADEAAIRKADLDWAKAAQTKNPDAWVAFYADDAVILPPNEKTATTRQAIRQSVAGLLALPELSINFQLTRIDVAKSGDIAYGYGTYTLAFKDSGKLMTDQGKIVEIWKKQANGEWKCVVDTWNTDTPLPPPAK